VARGLPTRHAETRGRRSVLLCGRRPRGEILAVVRRLPISFTKLTQRRAVFPRVFRLPAAGFLPRARAAAAPPTRQIPSYPVIHNPAGPAHSRFSTGDKRHPQVANADRKSSWFMRRLRIPCHRRAERARCLRPTELLRLTRPTSLSAYRLVRETPGAC